MKKVRLRVAGTSDTATIKREIQMALRKIVIARDGGCVLRTVYGVPPCNGYTKEGELILQADHLIKRSNSATYADVRLVVCVCKGHHGWKSVGSNARKAEYDKFIKQTLSPARIELWRRCEEESWHPKRTTSYDWKLALVGLKAILKTYE